MKSNILSLSIIMIIVGIVAMDFDAPNLTNNLAAYGVLTTSILLLAGLYIYERQNRSID